MTEETKETIEFAIDKVNEALGALEGPAAHGYEVLVRQSLVEGGVGVAMAVVLAVVAYLSGRLAWREIRSHDDFFETNPAIVLPLGAVASTGGIISLCEVSRCLPFLLNPEFYAIERLLGVL